MDRATAAPAAEFLIGMDDTDAPGPGWRGTGFHARELGRLLATGEAQVVRGITRHQLLVHPSIRYTSHNSAACLSVRAPADAGAALADACRAFLAVTSAPGADAGFCVARSDRVSGVVRAFGARAKREVLARDAAERLAEGLLLEGVTGDHGGVIGALAAVGLRAAGADGRFLWLPGLREAANRTYPVGELEAATGIERVQCVDGGVVGRAAAVVDLGPWPRAVLLGGRAVLLVERVGDEQSDTWRAAPKERIKQY